MTRILLYCPLNPNPPKLWRRTMESIVKVQWSEPLDIVLSSNDNPHGKPYQNILYQYNKARRMALDGGYDYLLTVESDMIIPPDTLKRLTALDCGVAYGLYVFRHTRHTWSAYTEIGRDYGTSLSANPDAAKASWGNVLEVAGVGLGCTLISRNTLKRVSFRLFDDTPDKTSCDWAFALDCKAAQITQRCDLGVVCGHISYTPYPSILWPDLSESNLYRRETLPGVEMKPVKAGDAFNIGIGETLKKAEDNGAESNHIESAETERETPPRRKKTSRRD